jgi:hypothetical protein
MNGTLCMESRTAGSLRELHIIRNACERYAPDKLRFTLCVFTDCQVTQTVAHPRRARSRLRQHIRKCIVPNDANPRAWLCA